ncbi:MAG: hypothetical protein ACYCQI_02920 [Gammaproteobacteria bacterium]
MKSHEYKTPTTEKPFEGEIPESFITQFYNLPGSQVVAVDKYSFNQKIRTYDFSGIHANMKPLSEFISPDYVSNFFWQKNHHCLLDDNGKIYRFNQGQIEISDLGKFNRRLLGRYLDIRSLQLLDDGVHLVGNATLGEYSFDFRAFIYNLATGKIFFLDLGDIPVSISAVTINGQPKLILGMWNKGIMTLDIDFSLEDKEEGQLAKQMISHSNTFAGPTKGAYCEVSPDGRFLLTVTNKENFVGHDEMTVWKISAEPFLSITALGDGLPIDPAFGKPSFMPDGSIVYFNSEIQPCRAVIAPDQKLRIEQLPLHRENYKIDCLSDGRILNLDDFKGHFSVISAPLYLSTFNKIVQQFSYEEISLGLPNFSHDITSIIAGFAAFFPTKKVPPNKRTYLITEIQDLLSKIPVENDKQVIQRFLELLRETDKPFSSCVLEAASPKQRDEISVDCNDFLKRLTDLFQPESTKKLGSTI